jgi:hypothetical protein
MSDAIKIEKVEKAMREIERLIIRSKELALNARKNGNEEAAKYFDGEAEGLNMAHRRILRAIK